jgi:hypothetical protein
MADNPSNSSTPTTTNSVPAAPVGPSKLKKFGNRIGVVATNTAQGLKNHVLDATTMGELGQSARRNGKRTASALLGVLLLNVVYNSQSKDAHYIAKMR